MLCSKNFVDLLKITYEIIPKSWYGTNSYERGPEGAQGQGLPRPVAGLGLQPGHGRAQLLDGKGNGRHHHVTLLLAQE